MPGSGLLGTKMAELLEMPHSTVTTAIKALRADRMLNIKGRGTSAAQMTADDAAAILVGIMSAAISADMPKIARLLLDMPCRIFMRDGRIVEPDTSESGQGGAAFGPRPHGFIDGLRDLFPETVSPRSGPSWSATAGAGPFFGEGDEVSVTVGVDGHRKKGFAVLEFAFGGGSPNKNFYSTCERHEERPAEKDAKDLGLGFYRKAPPFVFSATVSGRALFAIGKFLADGSEATVESLLRE